MKTAKSISIKSALELNIMREGGRILAEIIKVLTCSLKFGMTTKAVDEIAENLIREKNVIAAFKGYRGYPGSICISLNHEVVHGLPSERIILEGDIVSIDVGIIHKGYYLDTAVTIAIGKVDSTLEKLLEVAQQSLDEGIKEAKVGKHLSDISHAVQAFVEANHFSVVRDFVGHGIGRNLHEDPEIPNFGSPHQGPVLKEGMVLAIEPMVNVGSWQTKILPDGWTVVTVDGKPSAHFEHTVAITSNGPEILTRC